MFGFLGGEEALLGGGVGRGQGRWWTSRIWHFGYSFGAEFAKNLFRVWSGAGGGEGSFWWRWPLGVAFCGGVYEGLRNETGG